MFALQVSLCNYRNFPSSLHNRCVRISLLVSPEAGRNAEPCLVQDFLIPPQVDKTPDTLEDPYPAKSDDIELDDSVATVEVGPCPWADERGESRRQNIEFVIAVSLVLPTRSDAIRISSSSSSSSPTQAVLLGQCKLLVPMWSLCHIDKVKGFSAGTPAGIVGLMINVSPDDRASFARRLTGFFEAVNPNRVEGIPAILASPEVDEIMIFSKLHEKYYSEVPEFSAKGSFLDRVTRSFELYDLGTSRAAAALLNEWKGRELDLIARLACQHGPEASEIPVAMRLAAFCGEHGLPQETFRSLLATMTSMSAAQCENLFEALRGMHGAEPDPSRYLFPPLLRDDDILSAFGEAANVVTVLRSSECRNGNEQQSTSAGSRLHEYLGVQFASGTGSEAYSHLREREQSLATMRSLQATSTGAWPLSVEANELQVSSLSRGGSQGSFMYVPAAQNAVLHGASAGEVGKRAPTLAERERAQAAAERIARDASVQHPVPQVLVTADQVPRSVTSAEPPALVFAPHAAVEHRTTRSVEYEPVSEGDPWRSRSGEDRNGAAVRQGSRNISTTVLQDSNTSPSTGIPGPKLVASTNGSQDSMAATRSDPRSSAGYTTTVADFPQPVAALRPTVSSSTQVNIWRDLDPAHREEFLYGDAHSPQSAWASFQATFEATHRVPFHRLWYLSEEELQRLASEMNVPEDLQRIIMVERKSMTVFHTTVQVLPTGHPERAQVLRRVVNCTVDGEGKKPMCSERSFVAVGLVFAVLNATHAAVFEQHRDRQDFRQSDSRPCPGEAQETNRQSRSSSSVERPLKPTLVVDAVYVCASALLHSGSNNKVLDILAFGFPQRPARFYRHFTSAVRHAYRDLIGSKVDSVVPPLRECPLDILLCRVLIGDNVLRCSTPDTLSALPMEFDTAVISAGDADESWLVFDRQWILPVAWISGACLDPDAVACVNHPEAAALYRPGGGLEVLTRDVRAPLTTAQLLEMQSLPPLCLSCLAARSLTVLPLRQSSSASPSEILPNVVVSGPDAVAAGAEVSSVANESFAMTAAAARSSRSPSARHDDNSRGVSAYATTAVPAAAPPALPTFRSDGDMFAAAVSQLRSGKSTECYRLLHLLPQMFPNTASAAEAEGLLSELVDRHYVRAALHYREACRRNPSSVSALYRLANLLETRLDRPDEAFQIFQRAARFGDPLSAKRAVALHFESRHHDPQDDANALSTPLRPGGVSHVNHSSVKALQPPVGGDAVYIPSADRPRSRLF